MYLTSTMSSLMVIPAGLFGSFLLLYLESSLLSHLESFNKDYPKISDLLGIKDALSTGSFDTLVLRGLVVIISILFKLALTAFQVMSIVRLYQYGDKIFENAFPVFHTINCVASKALSIPILITIWLSKKLDGWKHL